MQVNNVTMDMGTTVGWTDTMIKNISFTPYEWAQFAQAVNVQMAQALYAGLIIGAIAGVLGLLAAFKYMEWKKERDGE
jgi:hypothetical protein